MLNTPLQCGANQFRCPEKCIALAWRCDGSADCANSEDEQNCPHPGCKQGEWTCDKFQFNATNRNCIPQYKYCDGVADCWDGSDEKSCCECER